MEPVLLETKSAELLPATEDRYEGVVVHMDRPADLNAFASSLRASLSIWRKQKKKGVWLKLPIECSYLVHLAVQEGFWYHHAEPDYLMMVTWLYNESNTLPTYPSNRVIVGAFVLNDQREVLVIKEKSCHFNGTVTWKIPTEVTLQGEDIFAGAVRAAKAATGVVTKFVEVLAFSQSHGELFGNSHIFFMCLLHPLTCDIQNQEANMNAAKWMPIVDYAAQSSVREIEMLKHLSEVCLVKAQQKYDGYSAVPMTSDSSISKINYIYVKTKDIDKSWTSGFQLSVASKVDEEAMLLSRHPSLFGTDILTDCESPGELLAAAEDAYGGVIVNMKAPTDPEAFICSLRASVFNWMQQGKKCVWIKLPIGLSNLVDFAVKSGLCYHYANPDYLMLVAWIHDSVPDIPVHVTHRVGVTAFVMNSRREVLVVQERNGPFKGTGIWKFPSGVVEKGEDIVAGAIREVKEETGVETNFLEVLAYRESHKAFFEKSDLFFVCMLEPRSFDIQKQDSEIEASKWMSIDDYEAQSSISESKLFKYINDICLAKARNGYAGFAPVLTKSGLSNKLVYLYLNTEGIKVSPSSRKT